MREDMSTRGWIIAAVTLVVVVGLVVVGFAVMFSTGGSDQGKDDRPELPATASVASASASSSAAPVPEESAQKDSRYGSFGRPQTRDEEEAARQGRSVATPKASSAAWDAAEVREGEAFAVDALKKFTAKTDKKTWHESIDPISTAPFKKAHQGYNPSYSAVGSVGGVISSEASGNPQLLVVKVSTDKGPFTVRVFRETADSPLQLDHVEPQNPRAAYGS